MTVNMDFERKKIKQDNIALKKPIRDYGCYFRSLISVAETLSGALLSVENINYLYDRCVEEDHVMSENCYMMYNLHHTVELAGLVCGSFLGCIQIGVIENNNFVCWNSARKKYTFMINQYKTNAGNHFTLADVNGVEIFDPLSHRINKTLEKQILYEVRVSARFERIELPNQTIGVAD